MTQQAPVQTFVVGIDRDAVLGRRQLIQQAERRGAWVTLAIGAAGIAFAVAVVLVYPTAGLWPFALLLVASMVPLLLSTVQARRLSTARERWYAENDPPPAAMRMTPTTLELACDGAKYPLALPWEAVLGLKQERRLGQPVLELALAPGVGAKTAGVRGLDQAAARATLQPSPLLLPIGLYSVATLDQPVHVIDQALRHFSDDRVTVLR